MNIIIKTISHKEQVYETVGDWRFDDKGNLNIFVSEMGDWKKELLVALHELVEVALCKDRGIKQKDVDSFDIEFEKVRAVYPGIIGNQEPGDMISAPYHKEHVLATSIEKYVASELGVNWQEYEEVVQSL